MYRPLSDGTRRDYGTPLVKDSHEIPSKWHQEQTKRYRLTPEKTSSSNNKPGISSFSTDDMPPLPPTKAIADVSIGSPIKNITESSAERKGTVDEINTILQSIRTDDSTTPITATPPTATPPSKALMSTLVKDSQTFPPDSPQTNVSFDYSDLGSPPRTPHSMTSENDFLFSSPPSIPISNPPKGDAAAVQPLLTADPVGEGWGPDKSDANIGRNITPRRALDEAFKALDKVGESGLADSGDEPSPITRNNEENSIISEDELSSLYASVDMTKKIRKDMESPREESDDSEEGPPIPLYSGPPLTTEEEAPIVQQSADPGYEELEFGSKNTQSPSSANKDNGYEDVEFEDKKGTKPRNKLSIDEDAGYARIRNKLSIDEDAGYARIRNKLSIDENTGYASVEALATRRPVSEDLSAPATENVHKASSEGNVISAERAEVHPPYRASMPPGVLTEGKSPIKTNGGSPSRNNE